MKNEFLSKITKFASALTFSWGGEAVSEPRYRKADVAVLKVAMMVAALDGDVTPDEFKAFEKLATFFPGYTPENARKALEEGLRSAGYIELEAKLLKEKELLALFLHEAETALPESFLLGTPADLRRAFALWTAMAMSDTSYSFIERKCISQLRDRIDELVQTVNILATGTWREISPAFAMAYVADRHQSKGSPVPTLEQLKEIEAEIAKMKNPEQASAAMKALKELVG